MSIVAMNWALRQRLASPLQQILLYVIADSAEINGVTRHCTPSYMETCARMTRPTLFRRLAELQELGLLERRKFYSERGDVRYEIVLNFEAEIDMPIKRRGPRDTDEDSSDGTSAGGSDEDETQEQGVNEPPKSHPETLQSGDQSLTGAQAKSHCGDFHIDDPSLPQKESPPYPPPGGSSSKMELEARQKRDALWERFKAGYPSIARMDQALARAELDALSLDDAEWAVSVVPALRDELKKDDCPPKNAHLWLRKTMFRNFPRGKLDAPAAPEAVWIVEGSDEDRALRFVQTLTGALQPFVMVRDGARGYLRPGPIGPDLLAMLAFIDESPSLWREVAKATPEWSAWQRAFRAWTGHIRRGRLGADDAIRVPGPFPPSKEGVVYDWPEHEIETAAELAEDANVDHH